MRTYLIGLFFIPMFFAGNKNKAVSAEKDILRYDGLYFSQEHEQEGFGAFFCLRFYEGKTVVWKHYLWINSERPDMTTLQNKITDQDSLIVKGIYEISSNSIQLQFPNGKYPSSKSDKKNSVKYEGKINASGNLELLCYEYYNDKLYSLEKEDYSFKPFK